MKVVVGSNILFSGLIKPAGKISQLLAHPEINLERYSCHFLMIELLKHRDKMIRFSGLEESAFLTVTYGLLRRITFIDESQLGIGSINTAEVYMKGCDPLDLPFLELNEYIDGWLWTGDKKLTRCLQRNDYKRVMNTDQLWSQFFGDNAAG